MACISEAKDAAAILTAIVGLFLAAKAIQEYRRGVEEKARDLRWRQTLAAKDFIDAVRSNTLSAAALKMIDWEGCDFIKPDGNRTEPIYHKNRRKQLRISDMAFNDGEPDAIFIRDCFDRLMEDMCLLETYIQIGLVEFSDVRPFFHYYMKLAAEPAEAKCLKFYADAFGFDNFHAFRLRFR
jgi:hypothetical protein